MGRGVVAWGERGETSGWAGRGGRRSGWMGRGGERIGWVGEKRREEGLNGAQEGRGWWVEGWRDCVGWGA